MAKQKGNYVIDLLPAGTMVEVVKYNSKTGDFVGMKLMSHGDFRNMVKQKGFRYQEFQKGFSQYHLKGL